MSPYENRSCSGSRPAPSGHRRLPCPSAAGAAARRSPCRRPRGRGAGHAATSRTGPFRRPCPRRRRRRPRRPDAGPRAGSRPGSRRGPAIPGRTGCPSRRRPPPQASGRGCVPASGAPRPRPRPEARPGGLGKTPEAPGLPMCLTARGSGDAWKRLCGSVPAGSCRTSVSGRGCPGGAVSPPVPLDGVMMRLCCGQGYVAERSHRPATHGNPPSGRTIVFCGQGGSRKAISPLSSFQGRSGPSSAAPHSAIALAFVPGSIPAWTSVVPGL